MMGEVDYLRTADDNERQRLGYLYDIYNNLPSAGEEGGDTVGRAVKDYIKAIVLDPINIIGFGAAKIGTSIAGRLAIKERVKKICSKNSIVTINSRWCIRWCNI